MVKGVGVNLQPVRRTLQGINNPAASYGVLIVDSPSGEHVRLKPHLHISASLQAAGN